MSTDLETRGGKGLEAISQHQEAKLLNEIALLKSRYASDKKGFHKAIIERFKNATPAENDALLAVAQRLGMLEERNGEYVYMIGGEAVSIGQHVHRNGQHLDGDALQAVHLDIARRIGGHEKLEQAALIQAMMEKLNKKAEEALDLHPGANIRIIAGPDGLLAIQVIASASVPAQLAGPVLFDKGGVTVQDSGDKVVFGIPKGIKGAVLGLLGIATLAGVPYLSAKMGSQSSLPSAPIAGPEVAGDKAKVASAQEPVQVAAAPVKPVAEAEKPAVLKDAPVIKLGKDPAQTVAPVGKVETQVGKVETQVISPEVQKMITTWKSMEAVLTRMKKDGTPLFWDTSDSNFKAGKEFKGILDDGTNYSLQTALGHVFTKALGENVFQDTKGKYSKIVVNSSEITVPTKNGDFIIKRILADKKKKNPGKIIVEFLAKDGNFTEGLSCPSTACIKK